MVIGMKTPPNTDNAANSPDSSLKADRPAAGLLSLLVCPLTRSALIYDAQAARLISVQAGLSYPIKGHVPIMLEEATQPLTEAERAKYTKA